MIRLLLLQCCLVSSMLVTANTIVVKNITELNAAIKKVQPGDIVILQNGEWKDVTLQLNCSGTKEKPITFRSQTPGKLIITGHSQLRLGGDFLVVDGFNFVKGYAGDDPVINFRTDNKHLANNCRVTNISINDFNNPKRTDENNWVAFYGKNNRLDHCSFKDKKNLGVLLAVILDDERSRENYHSIDHNYFGRRPPLASNGGEIIRVGVSQHCEFNSNTQITDNFFEQCDGETEIISIKSCSNVVRGNLFKESQGGVVLRHGNYNIVENNIFLGNGKEGTGGVRVINKGQWVINNFFYKCRGVDFRSPLSIMNGIPNSPANRYVQVTDAVIANNTFYDCSPISLCEGSDTERTLPPDKVLVVNNIFYNTRDSIVYKVFDDIKGFSFWSNEINPGSRQAIFPGFSRVSFAIQKDNGIVLPVTITTKFKTVPDSLQQVSQLRLQHLLSAKSGFANLQLLKKIQANAYSATGAGWLKQQTLAKKIIPRTVSCQTAEEVYEQLAKNEPVNIQLTGTDYFLKKPFIINTTTRFTGNRKKPITIRTGKTDAVFMIMGNGNLFLRDLDINGEMVKADYFISSDNSGSSDHYNLSLSNCHLQGFDREKGCKAIFYAYKSMVADSIIIRNNSFAGNNCNGIIMTEEKDDKGYYNAEKIWIDQNDFSDHSGILLDIYRGGNDESTMGPSLVFVNNQISNCSTEKKDPLLHLYGTQRSLIEMNHFINCNTGKTLIQYEDKVRAVHLFRNNSIAQSGRIEEDKFVENRNNRGD